MRVLAINSNIIEHYIIKMFGTAIITVNHFNDLAKCTFNASIKNNLVLNSKLNDLFYEGQMKLDS